MYNKPVFQYNKDYCIFYLDHWKLDSCSYVGTGEKSTGYVWSKTNVECPGDSGMNWSSGPYNAGQAALDIVITCQSSTSGRN